MNTIYKKWIKKTPNYLIHFNDKHDALGRFARKWGSFRNSPGGYQGDYEVDANDVHRRREDSGSKEINDLDNRGYTYVYDPNDVRDDEFYTQFGNRTVDEVFGGAGKIAGYESAGRAFCDHIFDTDDSDEIKYTDTIFRNEQRRAGEEYVMSLMSAPYDTRKTPEENRSIYEDRLAKYGPVTLGIGMGSKRHPWLDDEMREEGKRDGDTVRNDAARRVADELADEGYIGMRDFKDIGGNADVESATILFDKRNKMRR